MKEINYIEKLNYSDLRDEIHKILLDFFDRELKCYKGHEFDNEYLEFRTDDILTLIKRQGGTF